MATSISNYWVGQIPARPIAITVRDSNGRETNLSSYTYFKVRVVGSDNEEVDVSDGTLITAGAGTGRFVFRFPNGRSVFNKPGEYLMQLEFGGNGVRDFTDVHTIRVHRLGGIK
jgi:hypothetical protein